jgi:hypothetical protein
MATSTTIEILSVAEVLKSDWKTFPLLGDALEYPSVKVKAWAVVNGKQKLLEKWIPNTIFLKLYGHDQDLVAQFRNIVGQLDLVAARRAPGYAAPLVYDPDNLPDQKDPRIRDGIEDIHSCSHLHGDSVPAKNREGPCHVCAKPEHGGDRWNLDPRTKYYGLSLCHRCYKLIWNTHNDPDTPCLQKRKHMGMGTAPNPDPDGKRRKIVGKYVARDSNNYSATLEASTCVVCGKLGETTENQFVVCDFDRIIHGYKVECVKNIHLFCWRKSTGEEKTLDDPWFCCAECERLQTKVTDARLAKLFTLEDIGIDPAEHASQQSGASDNGHPKPAAKQSGKFMLDDEEESEPEEDVPISEEPLESEDEMDYSQIHAPGTPVRGRPDDQEEPLKRNNKQKKNRDATVQLPVSTEAVAAASEAPDEQSRQMGAPEPVVGGLVSDTSSEDDASKTGRLNTDIMLAIENSIHAIPLRYSRKNLRNDSFELFRPKFNKDAIVYVDKKKMSAGGYSGIPIKILNLEGKTLVTYCWRIDGPYRNMKGKPGEFFDDDKRIAIRAIQLDKDGSMCRFRIKWVEIGKTV